MSTIFSLKYPSSLPWHHSLPVFLLPLCSPSQSKTWLIFCYLTFKDQGSLRHGAITMPMLFFYHSIIRSWALSFQHMTSTTIYTFMIYSSSPNTLWFFVLFWVFFFWVPDQYMSLSIQNLHLNVSQIPHFQQVIALFIYLFILTWGFFFLLILEKEEGWGRERERNINMREKHQSVASHSHPNWWSNLQPMYLPWPGIKPVDFWCMEWHSN